ncbi:hypothetical protein SLE2022_374910 [Rubroshorea leprosula]
MKKEVIEILSSPEKEEVGTALRPIFCLKSIKDMKQTEEVEDCFILEFNPFDSVDISKLSIKTEEDATDLSVIPEQGQVACREYPHSRHICLKFPFDTTPHENFCEQCYCYVCYCAAPCSIGHCLIKNIVMLRRALASGSS